MRIKTNRASILLTTLLIITAVAIVAYSVFGLSLTTYRLSQRNDYIARARALADSEMEFIYFQIQMAMRADACSTNEVPLNLYNKGFCDMSNQGDDAYVPVTERTPFSTAAQLAPEGWIVKRSIVFDFSTLGTINNQTASYSYFTVKVEVTAAHSPVGAIDVRIGRRINTAKSSIFQFNIFAQGALEFAPGNNVTINGDIAANGSVYIGAQNNAASNLILNAYVKYLATGTLNTTTLANGTAIKAPVWGTDQALQAQTMDQPINLLGGLSANDIAIKYGTSVTADGTANPYYNALFGGVAVDANNIPIPGQLAQATNRVYRSVLTPPPDAEQVAHDQGSNGSSYLTDYPDADSVGGLSSITDDPSIAALRAYNHAGLVITVNGDGTMKFTAPGQAAVSYANAAGTGGIATSTTMYDLREQKTVAITEIDVAALSAKIASDYPNFNGLLYVYVANGSPDHPAAVRLANGASTPTYEDLRGFSVATNGGLYVKGDYNTDISHLTDEEGHQVANPAMLMADAITILSSSWNDDRVTPRSGDTADQIAWKTTPDASISANSAANNYGGTDYGSTYGYRTAATGTTRIGAGLLTGSITQNSSGDYVYSGGGHNLVRFLEDWSTSSVDFYGSIGRLFESAVFTHPFISPSQGDYKYVYDTPQTRTFTFNGFLKAHSPYGTPSPTMYDRGTIFTW